MLGLFRNVKISQLTELFNLDLDSDSLLFDSLACAGSPRSMAQQSHSFFDFYPDENERERKELVVYPVSRNLACNIATGHSTTLLPSETALDISSFLDTSGNQEAVPASQQLLEEMFNSNSAINARPQQSTKATPTSTSFVEGIAACPEPTPPRKTAAGAKRRWQVLDKSSEEYRKRRERNNVAVKKSREKTRLRTLQTENKVIELQQENQQLQAKIAVLTQQLELFKTVIAGKSIPGKDLKHMFLRGTGQES